MENLWSLNISSGENTADIYKVSLVPFIGLLRETVPVFNGPRIHNAIDAVYRNIYDNISIPSRCFDVEKQKWFVDFWEEINKLAQLKIITLNYDNILSQLLTGLKTGFDERREDGLYRFSPNTYLKNIYNDPVIINLHGSINYGYYPDEYRGRTVKQPPNDFIVQRWRRDLYYFEEDKEAYSTWGRGSGSPDKHQDGSISGVSPFIAGLRKMDKIMAIPYQFYFSSIYPLIDMCDKLIIIGYGFSDLHINRWLIRHSHIHNKRRKILIVTYKPPDFQTWWQQDYTSIEETHTICSLSMQSEAPDRRYKPEEPFVKSEDDCLGIWFNGFKSFIENGLKEGLSFLGI